MDDSSATTVKTDDLQMGYYVVAYVDLLGQREVLKKVKPLFPQNPEEIAELEKAAKDAIDVILNLHSTFSRYFTASSIRNRSPLLSPEQEKLYAEMTTSTVRSQGFSDGLVFFVSLRDGVPAGSVFQLLHACALLFLCQLECKQPVRIGVDLHFSVELGVP